MSEDPRSPGSTDPGAGPGGGPDGADVLRRAAREIRASKALEAFVPLSAAEREQLADRAIEQVLGRAPAELAALRRRRFARRAAIGSAVALAAVVALVMFGGRRGASPLAPYAMVVDGEQPARGAAEPTASPVRIRPETRIVVALTAERAERDALVRLLIVRDGRAALLDPSIARSGARLVIEAMAGELLAGQRDGPAELVAVLGRALPGDDEVRAIAAGAADPGALQVLRRAIVLDGFSHAAADALLGGCSAVLAAAPGAPPTCEVAEGRPLRLWIGAPAAAAIAVALDGAPLAARRDAREGGAALELDVAGRAGQLVVRVDDRAVAAWRLAPAPRIDAVRAADAAIAGRDLDGAAAALDAMPPDAPPEARLEALRRRATVAYARGDAERERAERERAVALARELGRTSMEIDQTVAIVYGLRNQHAMSQALPLLRDLEAHGAVYPEGVVHREIAYGLIASELGDLGAALGAFRRALALADRIGDTADAATVFAPLADVLQSLGRHGEVRALIDAEVERGERGASPCARVEAMTSAGWLLRELDRPRAERLVDRAVELAATSCERRVPIALVNQGWLAAEARRFNAAHAVLDRLARLPRERDARVALWELRLEAEVVLGQSPAQAVQHAERLAARAAALCSTELAYEADLLRARALVALDRPVQAAAAFAGAERALTLWSRLVPLGEGRATFFDRHDQLALTAIPFLLAQARRGQPGAAAALAATARRSIARFTASLAGAGRARAQVERGDPGTDRAPFARTLERWPVRLTAGERVEPVAGVCEARDREARAELEPAAGGAPARGESRAALLIHPLPSGLLVIAVRGAEVELRELAAPAPGERPDALSARIAAAAAPLVAGAERIQLHVHRTLAALPLDRSLAARVEAPIAFAVDAPPHPAPAPCQGARRALLIVNPQQNLWQASDAAPALRGDLARLGFAVDTLEGPAATRAAVEAHLADPCTALVQYDGHAAAAPRATRPRVDRGRIAGGSAPRGIDRVDDALLLAGGDALTAADVLGLPRVPEAVVLNGCTTAAPEGLGLAQAFVLAGADQVVASLDAIAADDAARFTTRLFAGAASGAAGSTGKDGLDLVRRFAAAVPAAGSAGLRAFAR